MRFYATLAVLALAGAGLYVLHLHAPWVLDDSDNWLSLTFLGLLLTALLVGWGGETRIGLRRGIGYAAAWGGLLALLVIGYEHREDLRMSALRALSGLAPGQPVTLSADETVLRRSASGHFTALALVNGQRVRMLVDTGATDVALPYSEAQRIGLDMSALSFTRPVLTANGRALVAPVTLREIRIGGVRFTNVRGSVAEPGRLPSALLGMSFLNRLSEFSFRGDRLVLKP